MAAGLVTRPGVCHGQFGQQAPVVRPYDYPVDIAHLILYHITHQHLCSIRPYLQE